MANRFETAEKRTIEIELMERLISGAMLALDSDIMEAMKNATPEARVDMFFTCITDKANDKYLKGELNEKQYLEAIGGSNTSTLFKETGKKSSRELRNFILNRAAELASSYCDRLEK